MELVNGASPCNVFWKVGSSATLGTTTSFKGTILALASITVNTGATVDGRLLARNAAVTLDSNLINSPECPSRAQSSSPAGVGEIDAAAAAAHAAPPNPNENLNAFVAVDPVTGQPAFDGRRLGQRRFDDRELDDGELDDRQLDDGELDDGELDDGELDDRELDDGELDDGELDDGELDDRELARVDRRAAV